MTNIGDSNRLLIDISNDGSAGNGIFLEEVIVLPGVESSRVELDT